MVCLFASLVSSQIKLVSTILVFNFFCCDFKNAEECLMLSEFIFKGRSQPSMLAHTWEPRTWGEWVRNMGQWRSASATEWDSIWKKKKTREKIIPHPLNVSVSREDPGRREQTGISEAEFLARGRRWWQYKRGRKSRGRAENPGQNAEARNTKAAVEARTCKT